MSAPATWYQQRRLRLIAGVSLTAAVVMLVLGITTVEPKLEGTAFFVWWGIVFGLVALAFIMAALDLSDIRRRLTAEKRELLKAHFDRQFMRELEEKLGEQQRKTESGRNQSGGGNAKK